MYDILSRERWGAAAMLLVAAFTAGPAAAKVDCHPVLRIADRHPAARAPTIARAVHPRRPGHASHPAWPHVGPPRPTALRGSAPAKARPPLPWGTLISTGPAPASAVRGACPSAADKVAAMPARLLLLASPTPSAPAPSEGLRPAIDARGAEPAQALSEGGVAGPPPRRLLVSTESTPSPGMGGAGPGLGGVAASAEAVSARPVQTVAGPDQGGSQGGWPPAGPTTGVQPFGGQSFGGQVVAGTVPEPSTWALMILGAFGTGIALRGERARARSALVPGAGPREVR